MSIVPAERYETGNADPERPLQSKQEVLDWLLPESLEDEIAEACRDGYEVTRGDTYDAAYDAPEMIKAMYDHLEAAGQEYGRGMGRFDMGRASVLTTIRYGAPAPLMRRWAKNRLRAREEKADELRSGLMYDRPEVQGEPWHEQGGKALALGTIVDASELATVDSPGTYETMSGRLAPDIVDHVFKANTGWLEGSTLREAVAKAEVRFKGRTESAASAKADEDIDALERFVGAPAQPGFRDIVVNCTDSLGIRSRKEEVRSEINRHVDASDKTSFLMMSVGCGTALPMLEVVNDLKQKGKDAKLILLDQDPIALAAAEQLARDMELEDNIDIHCERLFHGKGRQTKLLDLDTVLQGRKLDVCEDSGLREYLPDFLYKDLTRQAWESLEDDGIMTTGNMNSNRPQPEFLHGLMGWPIPVQMRYIKDIAELHRVAGVPREASRLRVTQEGVYTLCFSSKSATKE